ncbi:MAG: hypothetical protein ACR2KY_05250 [Thermoleophilaceae bacterium]
MRHAVFGFERLSDGLHSVALAAFAAITRLLAGKAMKRRLID